MTMIVRILVLSVAFTLAASGQQRSDLQLTDTVSVHRVIIVDPGISLGRPTLLLPQSLQSDAMLTAPMSLFLRANPSIPPPLVGGVFERRVDLTSPLQLQMIREERLRPLQTVLGSIQLAGVAYIAYQHVKKYGLR